MLGKVLGTDQFELEPSGDGHLLTGLTPDGAARLRFYAQVLGLPGGEEAPETKNGHSFELEEGEMAALVAAEVMTHYPDYTPGELRHGVGMMRGRATMQKMAPLDGRPTWLGAGLGAGDVEVVSRHRSHSKFYAMDEIELTHTRFDGTQSGQMNRSVVLASRAVILLPYDPIRDRVLLIEQFRVGPYARGDAHPWMLEPVAGMIDPGEDAEMAATREAMEEANIKIERLLPVADVYPSPGISSEFHKHYVGLCDLADDVTGLAGLAGENEDIKSHIVSADQLFQARREGRLQNAPLTLLALWLEVSRAAIRAGDI